MLWRINWSRFGFRKLTFTKISPSVVYIQAINNLYIYNHENYITNTFTFKNEL